jgi:hypothetical protein
VFLWRIVHFRRLSGRIARLAAGGRNPPSAGVAQLVEQLIRNQQVEGSSPFAGSNFLDNHRFSSIDETLLGLVGNTWVTATGFSTDLFERL